MISEKKFAYYEHFASRADEATAKAIEQLIAEVRKLQKDLDGLAHDNTALELKNAQLEKEADWIAETVDSCPPGFAYDNSCIKDQGKTCKDCWRKKAFEAVAE